MKPFRLVSNGWERELVEARRSSSAGLRIVCPFIKATTIDRIIRSGPAGPTEVVTRFDLDCFDQGVSDVHALRRILSAGGRIRGVRGLHSKLYLFGDDVAIGTSANLTNAALRTNHEFGFVAGDPTVVASCRAYFDRLWGLAGPDLTPVQIKDWEAVLAERRSIRPTDPLPPLPDFGTRISVETPFDAPAEAVAHDNQAFVKFFGSSDTRIDRSMPIETLIAENGAYWACTYPESKPPRQVRDGDLIFMGRLVRNPDDLMIFGQAIGRRHDDQRDIASAEDIEKRPWKADWPRYVRVHAGRYVNAALGAGVSFSAMLEAMRVDAFSSTQRNAEVGSGNLDPRKSLTRKAHMLLTDRSRAWISDRLEDALRKHGEVDVTTDRFAELVASPSIAH